MLMKQPPKPVTSDVAERDEFCTNKRYLIMKDESGRTGMLAIVDLLWLVNPRGIGCCSARSGGHSGQQIAWSKTRATPGRAESANC